MTEIVGISDSSLHRATNILESGGLVAFPTETVYGLGANACDGAAVAAIFAAKERPNFNPLISHVADIKSAFKIGVKNELASVLADCFWPGPMTLVLERHSDCQVEMIATAGLNKIAIRVPANETANKLLRLFDKPVAAPSANPSGYISPSTAKHVHNNLDGKIDLILDGGPCENGLESTIIDCTGLAPVLLRPGGISRNAIETAIKNAGINIALKNPKKMDKPVSPGQLQSHYAPKAKVRLNVTKSIDGEELIGFGSVSGEGIFALSLSKNSDLQEAAANLFAMLHQVDTAIAGSSRTIAIAPVPNFGIGEAINDRLRRAAARGN